MLSCAVPAPSPSGPRHVPRASKWSQTRILSGILSKVQIAAGHFEPLIRSIRGGAQEFAFLIRPPVPAL